MSRYNAFIDSLAKLAAHPDRGRAEIAALRRGNTGEARDLAHVYPLVLPHAPAQPEAQQSFIETACLFGLHPTPPDVLPRAMSMARAMKQLSEKSQSIEQRFIALLQSHREELVLHLRHCVSLAKANDLPLKWTDVLRALLWWNSDGSATPQRRWATEFWSPSHTESPTGASLTNSEPSARGSTP